MATISDHSTSRVTRKRKATVDTQEAPVSKRATIASARFQASQAATTLSSPPLTTMDSDDEFMSGLSSQDDDFDVVEDSSDDGFGEGLSDLLIYASRGVR